MSVSKQNAREPPQYHPIEGCPLCRTKSPQSHTGTGIGYTPRMPSKAAQMLRNRRLELDLSQFEVAQRAGVREKDVSRWETGRVVSPPLLGMYLVSRALGLDLVELAKALENEERLP